MSFIVDIKGTEGDDFPLWEKTIRQYCFQGGYGHAITVDISGYTIPHHWCVRPEYLNEVIEHTKNLKIKGRITIRREPEYEHWN